MHDQVLSLLDDCVTKLMVLRADLAAARCVRPGERRSIVLEAIDIADEFVTSAGVAIGESSRGESAGVEPAREPIRGATLGTIASGAPVRSVSVLPTMFGESAAAC
jgi:hypothetical protein